MRDGSRFATSRRDSPNPFISSLLDFGPTDGRQRISAQGDNETKFSPDKIELARLAHTEDRERNEDEESNHFPAALTALD